MTLPFPSRIPLDRALGFGLLLATVLFAEGNPVELCLIVLALLLTGVVGFNLVDGFQRPAGAYIFFVVLFTGLLGTMIKASTNELITNNVPNAEQTLLIYWVGTCGMVAAAWLSRRFAPRRPLLSGRLTQKNTSQAVLGCIVLGIGFPAVAYAISPVLGSITHQLNITLPLAVLIGVYQRGLATNGRSTFSWPVAVAWSYSTGLGILQYSKELMFAPSAAWLIAAAAARLRLSLPKMILLGSMAVFAITILVPFSQYGRNFRAETDADPTVALKMLEHPFSLREQVIQDEERQPDLYHWFDQPRGIFDRLTMLPVDSALIEYTDRTAPIGLTNTYYYLQNILPHFISPNKPDLHMGNDYAHKIGMLAPADHTTGISFSPYADAYHQAGWFGILFVMPAILFGLFLVLDAVVGSTNDAPWGMFFTLAFAHIAPEGLLLQPVYVASYGMEAIVATSFAVIYVTPLLGSLLLGPNKSMPISPGLRPTPVIGLRAKQH